MTFFSTNPAGNTGSFCRVFTSFFMLSASLVMGASTFGVATSVLPLHPCIKSATIITLIYLVMGFPFLLIGFNK